jgi:hypothetical protein
VVTLASTADPDGTDCVLIQVAAEPIEASDGYAARDALRYRNARTGLTDGQREALTELVTSSGLGSGTLPEPLLDSLINSAEVAKEALAASMPQLDRQAMRT